MLNEMNTCMGSQAVHRIQHKLNLLSEDLFPLLGDKGTEISDEVIILIYISIGQVLKFVNIRLSILNIYKVWLLKLKNCSQAATASLCFIYNSFDECHINLRFCFS